MVLLSLFGGHMHKKNYPMIDIMRIIASILVIGIHTYPFLQISPSLDFITTHIIGRIAVPFFFMTTAFFLFEHGEPTLQRLKKTLNQHGWNILPFVVSSCNTYWNKFGLYNI